MAARSKFCAPMTGSKFGSSPTLRARRVLLPRLLDRIAGHIVPERPGRHYPRPNDTKTRDIGYGQKKRPSKLVA